MFEFATAGKIVFGVGAVDQLPEFVRRFGTRALFVVGANHERAAATVQAVEARGVSVERIEARREPTLQDVQQAVENARSFHAQVVVAFGGGSALDTGKAVAAVATNPGPLLDYLEVVGGGRPLAQPGLPCIALPTTSGTGAEVTRNAVIDVPAQATKVSLRSEYLLPKVAVVDPRLTLSMPRALTAATGFDALAQVIEPFVSNRSNPMTDALATAGIGLGAKALECACDDGSDLDARRDMALVSLWGGLCLANARLGAVHGLAGPIGGMFHAPHGALCAALLGPVMRANVEALRRRLETAEGQNELAVPKLLGRYATIARLLTEDTKAEIEDGIVWIEQLVQRLGIQRLRAFGVTREHFDDITLRALRASSMQGNPVRLSPAEVTRILELAC